MASLGGLFGNAASSSKKLCQFELRLDEDFVVLRGHNTPSFSIKGRVVLMNVDTIPIKGIHIELEGKRRTTRYPFLEKERHNGPPSKSPIINKATIVKKDIRLVDEAKSIKAGNHEWPFEFEMEGDAPESIEGIPGNFVTYSIRATADRGLLAKDLVARKHLRIIRTLGDDALELIDPQDVNGFWPDKLKYSFATKSRAAIFGDKLVTNIELTPLIEKLRIGTITVALKEQRKIRTIPGPDFDPITNSWHGMWKEEHEVAKTQLEVPEGSEDTDLELQIPMYRFKSCLKLPRSLRTCRQTVERDDWIRIKHTIHYNILLHNADGHVSELRAHHNLKLFISPHLPVGADNAVAEPCLTSQDATPTLLEGMQLAPPAYATHQLDRLYEDIDPTGFMTPGTRNVSRRPSTERLVEQDDPPFATSSLNSQALQHRLMNLEQGYAEDTREVPTGQRHLWSSDQSPATSSRVSPDHQLQPEAQEYFTSSVALNSRHGATSMLAGSNGQSHVDYDMGALERMPSYGTAMRTPILTTPDSRPPTYEAATTQLPGSG